MTGLDTGFFVELLKGNSVAVELWKNIMENDESLVSCLTIYELKRLSLKGAIEHTAAESVTEAIMAICRVIWINDLHTLATAAGIAHGIGIPAMDSLILAGLVDNGARVVYTTDSHLENFKKKGFKVLNLKKGS